MADKKINDIILKSADILISKKLEELRFDKTISGIIVNADDAENGHYIVNDGAIDFDAYCENKTYQKDEHVYVTVPQGDFTQTKIIISKYTADNENDPITYSSPLDQTILISDNLVPLSQIEIANNTILANGRTNWIDTQTIVDDETIIERSLQPPPGAARLIWGWDLTKSTNQMIKNNGVFDTLAIKASFNCDLGLSYDMVSGSYGLLFRIASKINTENDNITIHDFLLDSSKMLGNPYYFLSYIEQTFTIDIANLGNIESIQVFLYQDSNFYYYNNEINQNEFLPTPLNGEEIDDTYNNIKINNLEIYFGVDTTQVNDDTFRIYTADNNHYNLTLPSSDDSYNVKHIIPIWYNKGNNNQYIGYSDGVYDYYDSDTDQIGNWYSEYDYQEELKYYEAGAKVMENDLSAYNIPQVLELYKSYEYILNINECLRKVYEKITKDVLRCYNSLYNDIKDYIEDQNDADSILNWMNTELFTKGEQDNDAPTGSYYDIIEYLDNILYYKEDKDFIPRHRRILELFGQWYITGRIPQEISNILAENTNAADTSIQEAVLKIKDEIDGAIQRINLYINNREDPSQAYNAYDFFDNMRKSWCPISQIGTLNLLEQAHSSLIQECLKLLQKAQDIVGYVALRPGELPIDENTLYYQWAQAFTDFITNKSSDELNYFTRYNNFIEKYANRYCIYWYRYKKGYRSDTEYFQSGDWERLSQYDNVGLPTSFFEKEDRNKYYDVRPDNPMVTMRVGIPTQEQDRIQAILIYNHQIYKSNILTFYNDELIIGEEGLTLDGLYLSLTDKEQNDRGELVKEDSYYSHSVYQLYGTDNYLMNAAEKQKKRKIRARFKTATLDDSFLIGSTIYWFIPTIGTMLDLNDSFLTYMREELKFAYFIPNYEQGGYTDTNAIRASLIIRPSEVEEFYTITAGNPSKRETLVVNGTITQDEADAIQQYRRIAYTNPDSTEEQKKEAIDKLANLSYMILYKQKVRDIENEKGKKSRSFDYMKPAEGAEWYTDEVNNYAMFYKKITGYTDENLREQVNIEDTEFVYQIKDYFVPTATNNTIKCKVIRNGLCYKAEQPFAFASFGTNGTDYSLCITPATNQAAVQDDKPLLLNIDLYDYNGEIIEDTVIKYDLEQPEQLLLVDDDTIVNRDDKINFTYKYGDPLWVSGNNPVIVGINQALLCEKKVDYDPINGKIFDPNAQYYIFDYPAFTEVITDKMYDNFIRSIDRKDYSNLHRVYIYDTEENGSDNYIYNCENLCSFKENAENVYLNLINFINEILPNYNSNNNYFYKDYRISDEYVLVNKNDPIDENASYFKIGYDPRVYDEDLEDYIIETEYEGIHTIALEEETKNNFLNDEIYSGLLTSIGMQLDDSDEQGTLLYSKSYYPIETTVRYNPTTDLEPDFNKTYYILEDYVPILKFSYDDMREYYTIQINDVDEQPDYCDTILTLDISKVKIPKEVEEGQEQEYYQYQGNRVTDKDLDDYIHIGTYANEEIISEIGILNSVKEDLNITDEDWYSFISRLNHPTDEEIANYLEEMSEEELEEILLYRYKTFDFENQNEANLTLSNLTDIIKKYVGNVVEDEDYSQYIDIETETSQEPVQAYLLSVDEWAKYNFYIDDTTWENILSKKINNEDEDGFSYDSETGCYQLLHRNETLLDGILDQIKEELENSIKYGYTEIEQAYDEENNPIPGTEIIYNKNNYVNISDVTIGQEYPENQTIIITEYAQQRLDIPSTELLSSFSTNENNLVWSFPTTTETDYNDKIVLVQNELKDSIYNYEVTKKYIESIEDTINNQYGIFFSYDKKSGLFGFGISTINNQLQNFLSCDYTNGYSKDYNNKQNYNQDLSTIQNILFPSLYLYYETKLSTLNGNPLNLEYVTIRRDIERDIRRVIINWDKLYNKSDSQILYNHFINGFIYNENTNKFTRDCLTDEEFDIVLYSTFGVLRNYLNQIIESDMMSKQTLSEGSWRGYTNYWESGFYYEYNDEIDTFIAPYVAEEIEQAATRYAQQYITIDQSDPNYGNEFERLRQEFKNSQDLENERTDIFNNVKNQKKSDYRQLNFPYPYLNQENYIRYLKERTDLPLSNFLQYVYNDNTNRGTIELYRDVKLDRYGYGSYSNGDDFILYDFISENDHQSLQNIFTENSLEYGFYQLYNDFDLYLFDFIKLQRLISGAIKNTFGNTQNPNYLDYNYDSYEYNYAPYIEGEFQNGTARIATQVSISGELINSLDTVINTNLDTLIDSILSYDLEEDVYKEVFEEENQLESALNNIAEILSDGMVNYSDYITKEQTLEVQYGNIAVTFSSDLRNTFNIIEQAEWDSLVSGFTFNETTNIYTKNFAGVLQYNSFKNTLKPYIEKIKNINYDNFIEVVTNTVINENDEEEETTYLIQLMNLDLLSFSDEVDNRIFNPANEPDDWEEISSEPFTPGFGFNRETLDLTIEDMGQGENIIQELRILLADSIYNYFIEQVNSYINIELSNYIRQNIFVYKEDLENELNLSEDMINEISNFFQLTEIDNNENKTKYFSILDEEEENNALINDLQNFLYPFIWSKLNEMPYNQAFDDLSQLFIKENNHTLTFRSLDSDQPEDLSEIEDTLYNIFITYAQEINILENGEQIYAAKFDLTEFEGNDIIYYEKEIIYTYEDGWDIDYEERKDNLYNLTALRDYIKNEKEKLGELTYLPVEINDSSDFEEDTNYYILQLAESYLEDVRLLKNLLTPYIVDYQKFITGKQYIAVDITEEEFNRHVNDEEPMYHLLYTPETEEELKEYEKYAGRKQGFNYKYGVLVAETTINLDYSQLSYNQEKDGDKGSEVTDRDSEKEENKTRPITLKAYYPVPWSASTENNPQGFYIEGPSTVVYDSSGVNPKYYSNPFVLYQSKDNLPAPGNITWSIGYLPEDTSTTTLIRDYMPKIKISENKITKKKEYRLQVPTMYMSNNNYVCYVVAKQGSRWLYVQPIILMQNRFASPMLNAWDGELTIDENNGIIMSAMVGAGKKEDDNSFSGVLMGQVAEKTLDSATSDGLFGYNHGEQSFAFKTDGTAFIGKAGRGRIQFDGNSGTIQSMSYDEKTAVSPTGMKIDLDDGVIEIKGSYIDYTRQSFQEYFAIKNDKTLTNAEKEQKIKKAVQEYYLDPNKWNNNEIDGLENTLVYSPSGSSVRLSANSPYFKIESPTEFYNTDALFIQKDHNGNITIGEKTLSTLRREFWDSISYYKNINTVRNYLIDYYGLENTDTFYFDKHLGITSGNSDPTKNNDIVALNSYVYKLFNGSSGPDLYIYCLIGRDIAWGKIKESGLTNIIYPFNSNFSYAKHNAQYKFSDSTIIFNKNNYLLFAGKKNKKSTSSNYKIYYIDKDNVPKNLKDFCTINFTKLSSKLTNDNVTDILYSELCSSVIAYSEDKSKLILNNNIGNYDKGAYSSYSNLSKLAESIIASKEKILRGFNDGVKLEDHPNEDLSNNKYIFYNTEKNKKAKSCLALKMLKPEDYDKAMYYYESPYKDSHTLIEISDRNYFLQTDNYNQATAAAGYTDGSGLKFDLQSGKLDAYNFTLFSCSDEGNFIKISSEKNQPYIQVSHVDPIGDNDGIRKDLLKISDKAFILQSQNFLNPRTEYTTVNNEKVRSGVGQGTKIDLATGLITSYNFNLYSENTSELYSGSFIQLSNSGSPFLQVHFRKNELDKNGEPTGNIIHNNDLLYIGSDRFFIRSQDYKSGQQGIQFDLTNGKFELTNNFDIIASITDKKSQYYNTKFRFTDGSPCFIQFDYYNSNIWTIPLTVDEIYTLYNLDREEHYLLVKTAITRYGSVPTQDNFKKVNFYKKDTKTGKYSWINFNTVKFSGDTSNELYYKNLYLLRLPTQLKINLLSNSIYVFGTVSATDLKSNPKADTYYYTYNGGYYVSQGKGKDLKSFKSNTTYYTAYKVAFERGVCEKQRSEHHVAYNDFKPHSSLDRSYYSSRVKYYSRLKTIGIKGVIELKPDTFVIRSTNFVSGYAGTMINLNSGLIRSYNFELDGQNNTFNYAGSYVKLTSNVENGGDYFVIHHKDRNAGIELNLLRIGTNYYQFNSVDYNTTNRTGMQLDLMKGKLTAYNSFNLLAYNSAYTSQYQNSYLQIQNPDEESDSILKIYIRKSSQYKKIKGNTTGGTTSRPQKIINQSHLRSMPNITPSSNKTLRTYNENMVYYTFQSTKPTSSSTSYIKVSDSKYYVVANPSKKTFEDNLSSKKYYTLWLKADVVTDGKVTTAQNILRLKAVASTDVYDSKKSYYYYKDEVATKMVAAIAKASLHKGNVYYVVTGASPYYKNGIYINSEAPTDEGFATNILNVTPSTFKLESANFSKAEQGISLNMTTGAVEVKGKIKVRAFWLWDEQNGGYKKATWTKVKLPVAFDVVPQYYKQHNYTIIHHNATTSYGTTSIADLIGVQAAVVCVWHGGNSADRTTWQQEIKRACEGNGGEYKGSISVSYVNGGTPAYDEYRDLGTEDKIGGYSVSVTKELEMWALSDGTGVQVSPVEPHKNLTKGYKFKKTGDSYEADESLNLLKIKDYNDTTKLKKDTDYSKDWK